MDQFYTVTNYSAVGVAIPCHEVSEEVLKVTLVFSSGETRHQTLISRVVNLVDRLTCHVSSFMFQRIFVRHSYLTFTHLPFSVVESLCGILSRVLFGAQPQCRGTWAPPRHRLWFADIVGARVDSDNVLMKDANNAVLELLERNCDLTKS